MSIDFAEWKKGNREKWKIMDEVFPKIKKLLQGGRVVQFSIENNHPVMRTFESKRNDMPIKTIDGQNVFVCVCGEYWFELVDDIFICKCGRKNAFGKNEIISETPASITVKDEGYDFAKNVHVYSVTVVEE